MSTSARGLVQAVLRVSAADPDPHAQLRRAFGKLAESYPDETFTVAVTANVVLRSTTKHTFDVYFGQRFGNSLSVFLGQQHDDDDRLTQLFQEYQVGNLSDVSDLPSAFTAEDFGRIYKRNFDKSSVVVHSVVSLIYIFALGLEDFAAESSAGPGMHTVW